MKILVIGCGSIGTRHIGNILKHEKHSVFAFDVDAIQLAQLKKKYPNITLITQLKDVWKVNPDVAFITTPTSLHIQYALEAAQHKCHLFVEKPLSNSLQDIQRLIKIIKQKKLVTMVGCNMRFYWAIAKIKQLLEKKTIGTIHVAQISTGSYLPDWHAQADYRKFYSAQKKLGGGVILDGIHELDYASWFFGNVKQLISMYGKLSNLDIDTEDCAEIVCKFNNGPLTTIHMDYFQRTYQRSCTLIGEKGSLVWEFNEHQIKIYRADDKKWKIIYEPKKYLLNQMYIDEIDYFFSCISHDKNTFNSIIDAQETLRLALSVKQKGIYVN